MSFCLVKSSEKSKARLGTLTTMHGIIHTPFFMPIATKGAVKGLEANDVAALGAEIILSNTYHLYLQPGVSVIKKLGGIHGFMKSPVPILTDSGGFQIFSLSKLRTVDKNGVTFQSHIDGSKHRLTPEKSIKIQSELGSDIAMAFDYFPGYPATKKTVEHSLKITTKWAKQCIEYKRKLEKKNSQVRKQLLFGIVQGSTYKNLREESVKGLLGVERDFSAKGGSVFGWDGFAVGGLAVGEPAREMYRVLDYTVPLLPENKPRYLMGVGYPEQIVEAVKRGIDMFDCVIPTREGRHGRLFVWKRIQNKELGIKNSKFIIHNSSFYSTINIANAKFKSDTKPVDPTCDCPLCTKYSRAYLYQLFKTQDFLGQRLATIHNLRFYLQLMGRIQLSIKQGKI